MADRAQLIEALRKADAAGNKEDALRIAAMIRAQPADGPDTRPTSDIQGFYEEVAKGGANALRAIERADPAMRTLRLLGLPTLSTAIDAGRRHQSEHARSRGSTFGRIAGGVVASLPTMAIPGGPVVQGMAQGALLSDAGGDARGMARDAVIGGVTGKGGQLAGKYIAAPVAERVARTRPVRAVAEAAARALKKTPIPLPQFTRGERALNKASREGFLASPDIAAIRAQAADANRLNVPIALVDTNPKLRALGGSVSRFSPKAKELAEKIFAPRADEQTLRAVNAIDKNLAPITDIESRAGDIGREAWNASGPFYKKAFAQAAPIDEAIAGMLRRPAGKAALQRAYRIAANEGRDPLAMGFDLDNQGDVVIKQMPSMETLDLVKRGFDDVLNDFRDPLSGKLVLEGKPEAKSVNSLLQQFKSKLDEISPDYAMARAVYQEKIAPRSALRTGYETLPADSIPQRQFDAAVGAFNENTLPEAQRGLAAALAERAAKSQRPYNAIYGPPGSLRRGKMASMFPEGAADFDRIFALEKEMGKTTTELLGGSHTQPRAMSDAQFAGDMIGDLAEAGLVGTVAGGGAGLASGGINALRRAAAQGIADRAQLGLFGARAKAENLAPLLYDTNPGGILQILDDLMRKNAESEARKKFYGDTAGRLLAAPAAAGAVSTFGAQ